MRGSRASSRDDRGAVTVEAALALCSLTVVVALAVAAITAAATSVRCTDAARELVRLAGRAVAVLEPGALLEPDAGGEAGPPAGGGP